MIAWRETRRFREQASDYADAAELCVTAAIWAWTRPEGRRQWAMRVVERSKGAGAPRNILWGEGSPMPDRLWWRERAALRRGRGASSQRHRRVIADNALPDDSASERHLSVT
jgi:hypothetical protein